jgi:hypothetical protein
VDRGLVLIEEVKDVFRKSANAQMTKTCFDRLDNVLSKAYSKLINTKVCLIF